MLLYTLKLNNIQKCLVLQTLISIGITIAIGLSSLRDTNLAKTIITITESYLNIKIIKYFG